VVRICHWQIADIRIGWAVFLTLIGMCCLSVELAANEIKLRGGEAIISYPEPDARGGRAYKLEYLVDVPIEVFWKFKTDFDNTFLLSNKYIKSHKFVSCHHNVVITENVYTQNFKVTFRWQTTMITSKFRLEFVLINPKECRQKFHYGYIQLEPFNDKTKVTHVAYFDFFGAFLWANYPWAGGMKSFLRYTARWEQKTILRLKKNYMGVPSK
jgi:hypothetical protein